MKKLLTLAMVALMASLPMLAQRHNYGSTPSNRYDYERSHSRWIRNYYGKDMYFGLRIGPAFSHVSGDAISYAGDSKTGLHLGGVVGFELTNRAPVFFETGLSYVNKGGKGTILGDKVTTDLSYLELPLVFKYIHYTDMGLSIHPLFGGYLAVGVDGKTKYYSTKHKESAFSKDGFKRFDGGLRMGCGVEFAHLYAELAYDLGLSNICHDTFNSSRNGCLLLSCGVNF